MPYCAEAYRWIEMILGTRPIAIMAEIIVNLYIDVTPGGRLLCVTAYVGTPISS